ncbi:MAG TPA: ankyrin repeat domain-containing protein [Candidatus Acidoferrum sp.]|jgi:hypothetical protein
MGSSFTNYQVRTNDAAKCAKVVAGCIASRAVLTDPQNGWITVYDEKSESQDIEVIRSLTKNLSSKLKTAVFAIVVHDSDIFVYLVYKNGQLLDRFDSKPDHFGPVGDAQKKEWVGNLDKLLSFAKKGTSVRDLQRVLKKEHVFEEERAAEFAKVLGWKADRARTGFKYIQETRHSFKLIYAKGFSSDSASLVEKVSRGDAAGVRALLEKGVSPDQKDKFGIPLLVHASSHGRLEIVRDLVSSGADLFAGQPGGGDALWAAAAGGHRDLVAYLLEKAKGNEKFAPRLKVAFSAAVRSGHVEIVKDFLRAGADVNASYVEGQPPLTLACIRGDQGIWEALYGREMPIGPGQRKTDWKEMVMVLLEAGAVLPCRRTRVRRVPPFLRWRSEVAWLTRSCGPGQKSNYRHAHFPNKKSTRDRAESLVIHHLAGSVDAV